jgi:hypothetical protein
MSKNNKFLLTLSAEERKVLRIHCIYNNISMNKYIRSFIDKDLEKLKKKYENK